MDFSSNLEGKDLATLIAESASALGADPVDLATVISYETGGTFDPMQPGPTTRWGQHRGLIQFGEPQADQYGANFVTPEAALTSQLGADGAVVKYLQSNGYRQGMGILDLYSIINTGSPNNYSYTDAAAGGAPGTVRDKVENQMGGHRENALALLGNENNTVDLVSSENNTVDLVSSFQRPTDLVAGFSAGRRTNAVGLAPPPEYSPPANLIESFQRGVRSGTAGMQANFSYFGAAAKALVGAEDSAADSVANARILEEFAAIPMQGIETVEEFLDEPTFSGFLTQVFSTTGQIVPSAIETTVFALGGAGVGGLVARQAMNQTAKKAAESLVREAAEKVIKKTATPDEQRIAQAAYEALREANYLRRGLTRGALGGAAAGEYIPLTGSNVSEALESGRELTPDQAIRAGLVAAPQAAVGVLGEAALVRLLAKKALSKSAGPNSVMGRLATSLGSGFARGGLIEGAAEGVQEEIAIRNRMAMDDSFDEADANLRRMNALFAGFFGGAALGGAGSVTIQGTKELGGAASGALDAVASVADKASDMAEGIKSRMTSNQHAADITGESGAGQTSPEAERDIDAQLNAVLNDTSSKKAVWVAGAEPDPRFVDPKRTRSVQVLNINGQKVFSAFVEGRGTIISADLNVVLDVVKGRASDAVLAAALGYSRAKQDGDSLVVRVYDQNGDIVSEETTSEVDRKKAENAAKKIMPEGGSFRTMPIEEALAERQRRAKPDVQFMEDDVEIDPLEAEQNSNEQVGDQEFEVETRTHTFERKGGTVDRYQPVENNNYEGIDEARTEFEQEFGGDVDINWDTPLWSRMSRTILRTATALQKANPDEVVSIKPNPDLTYRIEIETTPDTQKVRIREKGLERELPVGQFIEQAVTQASKAQQKFRTFNIKRPGSDKFITVNPVDLMNAGRRLQESISGSFGGSGAVQSARQGLIVMLGELQLRGYEVDVQGRPISEILETISDPTKELVKDLANLTVAFNQGGERVSLEFLLKPYIPGAPDPLADLVDLEVTDSRESTERRKTITDDYGDEVEVRRTESELDRAKDLGPGEERVRVSDLADERDPEVETVTREEELNRSIETTTPLSTTLEMTEQSARTSDGIPLTQINIEDVRNVDTTQNRPKGSAPVTGPSKQANRPKNKLTYSLWGQDKTSQDLLAAVKLALDTLHSALGFETPTTVVSLRGFQKATKKQIESYFPKKTFRKSKKLQAQHDEQRAKFVRLLDNLDLADHEAVGNFLKQLAAEDLLTQEVRAYVVKSKDLSVLGKTAVERAAYQVTQKTTPTALDAQQVSRRLLAALANPRTKGFHTAYDGGTYTMVNDLVVTNPAELALVAAHEAAGHKLFKEEINKLLDNKPLYERLYKAFEADRDYAKRSGTPIGQYEAKTNSSGASNSPFEEWYADKTAAEAQRLINNEQRAATNAVDSHFKRLVDRLKKAFEVMASRLRRRFAVNPTFSEYFNGVMEARKPVTPVTEQRATESTPSETDPTQLEMELIPPEEAPTQLEPDFSPSRDLVPFEQKAVVKAIRVQIENESGFSARSAMWARQMKTWGRQFTAKHPHATNILGLFLPADDLLAMVAGREVADLFYIRSNTKSGLGFIRAMQRQREVFRAELFEILGTDWTTDEVQAALKEAQGKTPTVELQNEKAKEVRKFLERLHDNYIAPSNTDIGFREDYFPVLLNLAEISHDPEIFIDIILKADPDAKEDTVRAAVDRIINYNAAIDARDNSELVVDEKDLFEPGTKAERERKLTVDGIEDLLRDLGYVQEPEVALLTYLNAITKRVEWNRHMKAEDGTNKLEEGLKGLTAKQLEVAHAVINAHLGNVRSLPSWWLKSQSYVQAFNLMTLLPASALASIPDFAGAIVQTKEFSGFGMALKEIVQQIKESRDGERSAERLAYDVGVVLPEASANAFMSQADSDMLDPKVRAATDKFFKWTGLTALTNFNREFATGMAKRFLVEHANHPNSRSSRYLSQLGITAEQVREWQANEFSLEGEAGAAAKAAINRFVESSALRPNSAERPLWASDPRFALVWQLKQFIYSFHKVILTGIGREYVYRIMAGEGVAAAMAPLLIITLAAFMPLAALGLELREYAKVGLSYALPGIEGSMDYLKTDSMDYGTYFVEVFQRAGLDGPMSILSMAQRNGDWGGSALASILGPTAELGDVLLRDFPRIDQTVGSRFNSPQEQAGAILGVAAIARAAL